MFMGEYNHTMDTKGRLIVPAKFREAGGDRFVVTKGLEKCLFLFTEEKWDSVVESISHMPLTHKNARAFSRFFIGSAGECEEYMALIRAFENEYETVLSMVKERTGGGAGAH